MKKHHKEYYMEIVGDNNVKETVALAILCIKELVFLGSSSETTFRNSVVGRGMDFKII